MNVCVLGTGPVPSRQLHVRGRGPLAAPQPLAEAPRPRAPPGQWAKGSSWKGWEPSCPGRLPDPGERAGPGRRDDVRKLVKNVFLRVLASQPQLGCGNYVRAGACWQNTKRSPRSSHHEGINQAENTKTARKTPATGCAASDARAGSRARRSYLASVINKPLGKRVVSALLHSRVAFMAKQPQAPAAAQGFFPITCRDAAAPRPSPCCTGRGGVGTRSCSYTLRATA